MRSYGEIDILNPDLLGVLLDWSIKNIPPDAKQPTERQRRLNTLFALSTCKGVMTWEEIPSELTEVFVRASTVLDQSASIQEMDEVERLRADCERRSLDDLEMCLLSVFITLRTKLDWVVKRCLELSLETEHSRTLRTSFFACVLLTDEMQVSPSIKAELEETLKTGAILLERHTALKHFLKSRQQHSKAE